MSARCTNACTVHDSPANPAGVLLTLVRYGRSARLFIGDRTNAFFAICSGVNGGFPAPASRPPYGVIVTFTPAAVNARTLARLEPAWHVIDVLPPCSITTGSATFDALGNRLDTSPIRAQRSAAIVRAGTMSSGVTGSPTAYPIAPPATAATPQPIAVPRTSRLATPATLTTQRSSLTPQQTPPTTHTALTRFQPHSRRGANAS